MVDKIKLDLEKIVNNDDVYIFSVSYVFENQNNFLKVVIDSKTLEIDLDLCVEVTRKINVYLDEVDPISDDYMLEVTSKGIEEDIESIEEVSNAIGEFIYIKTKEKVDDKSDFVGKLLSFNNNQLEIECNIKSIKKKFLINYDLVKIIRYSIEF